MGLFYSNFTLRGPTQLHLVEVLRSLKRTAFVSPAFNGCITLYDRESEEQNFDIIEGLGRQLTRTLNCAALAAVLHDDDVLYYWLFRDGTICHDYNSSPAYFDPNSEPKPPTGGNSLELCAAFGCPTTEPEVHQILNLDLLSEQATIPCELERHAALVRVLGLPPCSAGVGFGTIEGGFLPVEFNKITFTRVG